MDALLANFPRFKKPRAEEAPNHDYSRAKAKLLQAWATCKKLVDLMSEVPPDADVELDAPLSQHIHDDIQDKFKARYHFEVPPDFSPDEVTITRYFRGLSKNKALKVFDMKVHKALGKTNGVQTEGGVIKTVHQ